MKKRVRLFFGILLLSAGCMWAQTPKDIPLTMLPGDSIPKPKSPIQSPLPLAELDGKELTISFSSMTASQVVIMDENNNYQVVYSESFVSTTQVFINLEDDGIGEGHYLLWLFAFGEWWKGEFIIEEE